MFLLQTIPSYESEKIVRTEHPDGCICGLPTGLSTSRRRYKTKEHEQLLCNGVTKQKNANNYFATALQSKRTRTITFERRYQTKEREQLLCNGVTKQKNASNYF